MHYKYLFLILSNNDNDTTNNFYSTGAKCALDTWGKDIIRGEYPECEVFVYTAADDLHPAGIDFDNHYIYVDAPDDSKHLFTKTSRCMTLLNDNNVTWDYIIRTNSSVYINIRKTIELIATCEDNVPEGSKPIIADWMLFHPHYKDVFPAGCYMILPKALTDIYSQHDDESEDYIAFCKERASNLSDDSAVGVTLSLYPENGYTPILVRMMHYKCITPVTKILTNQMETNGFVEFPSQICREASDVNNHHAIQIRQFFLGYRDRYVEFEHMYELHNALNK